jgi:ELWxxDGT repeat protein
MSRLLFSQVGNAAGPEPWVYDIATGTTSFVADINPGGVTSFSKYLADAAGTHGLFVGSTGPLGVTIDTELWSTAGAGNAIPLTNHTRSVAAPIDSETVAGVTYVTFAVISFDPVINGPVLHQHELWRTDGTVAGTQQLAITIDGDGDYSAGTGIGASSKQPSEMFGLNGKLMIHGEINDVEGLLVYNGALSMVKPMSFDKPVVGSTKALFAGQGGSEGTELWVTDGTSAGTQLVVDFNVGASSSLPLVEAFTGTDKFAVVARASSLSGYLILGETTRDILLVSDGTAAGTTRLGDVGGVAAFSNPFLINGGTSGTVCYFWATTAGQGAELWKTDGTEAGTSLVKDINAGSGSSRSASNLGGAFVGNTFYFFADDGTHGVELWKTDGTAVGTSLVKDIGVGLGSPYASGSKMAVADGHLFFTGNDFGTNIYRTDGTAQSTVAVALDISAEPGFEFSVLPDEPHAPTDIALSTSDIQEFRANGTVVGDLSTTDPNVGDTFTYTLLDDAGGRFALAGNQIRVANGLLLDFEQAASHDIQVRAMDSAGNTFTKSLTITVDDVNPEIITGDAANNILFGGALADTLKGQSGADTLNGGSGNDSLDGGTEADYLNGGLGRDIMTGGLGADVFDFNAIKDSGKTAASRDVIKDFKHGQDKIDIFDIDAIKGTAKNDKFHFIGTADFNHIKGELHYVKIDSPGIKKDMTIVEGDVNGDGKADFQIQLSHLINLTKGDFIL